MKAAVTHWKVLIIEDDPDLSDLIKYILEKQSYQVFRASNGTDGISLNQRHNPDLILLDLHMPDMDGIETLRHIREYDDTVLVVILTGYASPDTIRDAADLNVSEYLSKPFENKYLVSVIGKALEQ